MWFTDSSSQASNQPPILGSHLPASPRRTFSLPRSIMGKSYSDWLRKWYGTQLPLLAVGSACFIALCYDLISYLLLGVWIQSLFEEVGRVFGWGLSCFGHQSLLEVRCRFLLEKPFSRSKTSSTSATNPPSPLPSTRRYIEVMRYLQSTYWLEPAGKLPALGIAYGLSLREIDTDWAQHGRIGSHGVWGLDDYHFLPFLFGSSQLRGHKYLRPKSIHDPDVLEGFSQQYMYLACIQFINSVGSIWSWSRISLTLPVKRPDSTAFHQFYTRYRSRQQVYAGTLRCSMTSQASRPGRR